MVGIDTGQARPKIFIKSESFQITHHVSLGIVFNVDVS